MKKIFTLISMALVAMSVNAQIWKAAEYDLSTAESTNLTTGIYSGGDAAGPNTSMAGSLEASVITGSVGGLTMTGVSTPNNLSSKDIAEGKKKSFWELKGKKATDENPNDALITDDCGDTKFAQYLMPQGNPTFVYWDYEEETADGMAFRVGDIPSIYWTPGNDMPVKGAYWKFAATKKGSLRVAIYGNKNSNPTYIVDESTKQPLAPANVTVSIYYQNTGFVYEGSVDEGTAKYFNVGPMADDYVLQHTNGCTQNRPVLGFIDFDVEAGKTYWLFNPKSQIGLYGFYFKENAGTSIERTKMLNDNDAALFNLAGQKVDKSQKGILIQNGKKFVNK